VVSFLSGDKVGNLSNLGSGEGGHSRQTRFSNRMSNLKKHFTGKFWEVKKNCRREKPEKLRGFKIGGKSW
jgi:hypothetical protein